MQISVAILVGGCNAILGYVAKTIKNFQSRVLSYPNSIFEAKSCLNTTLTNLNIISLLNDSSLITTPNAVNSGLLYSIIPSNGNGDMDVVRATTATRVNSLGLIESVAANVPRLNYDVAGGCPSILVEPQRTNLLLNSVWAGGGDTPTSWTKQFTGNTITITSIKNPNVTAYNFNGVATMGFFHQSILITSGVTYSWSIYVESVVDSIQISNMLNCFSLVTQVYTRDGVVITPSTEIQAGFRYTLTGVATSTTTVEFRLGLGVGGVDTVGRN